ncbi:Maf family protein [Kribbia dieselivorans]|uniref:Maf family protein n=1 Tax=Kribbia dieselivorans TaxID=331526 RepID=UPI0008396038|nr:nucleoside triphosphate pyrophosphatase [Kribbia dieselivorans]
MPIRVVLASASPARLNLLRQAGVEPTVIVSEVDEAAAEADARERYGDLEPADIALVLARAKAEDVAEWADAEDAFVIGCDSVLEFDGEAFGKPADAAEAIARWQRMRGRTGVLHTGHWLIDTRETAADDPDAAGTGATLGATASTTVHFGDLDDAEIEAYVATGEPLRCAGAFTIDGLGAPYIDGVDGDPSNVIGLSLPLLRSLLAELDIPFSALRP